MKKSVIITRIFCALALVSLFITSCASDNNDEFPFITIEGEETEHTHEHTEYIIVISASASGEISQKARLLANKINERTGAAVSLAHDDRQISPSDGTHLIYIGNVDALAVTKKISQMRSLDYTCRAFENYTIIGGKGDGATLTAIDRFVNEILPLSTEQRLIPEGGGFDFAGKYEVESLFIDGVSLGDFSISVDSVSDTAAVDVAYSLRDKISEDYGYWIDIRIGSIKSTENYIRVLTDLNCRSGRGVLERNEKIITLKAADRTGLSRVADNFIKQLSSAGVSGNLNPSIPKNLYIPYGNTECTVAATVMELLPALSSPLAATSIKNSIEVFSPDMILFGETDDKVRQILSDSLNSYTDLGSSGGRVFGVRDMTATRLAGTVVSGAMCDAFLIRYGELEFVLIYVSGGTGGEATIDIEHLLGENPLPVVALSYTQPSTRVTFRGGSYFECITKQEGTLYGKGTRYSCYADVSRLSVVVDSWANSYGFNAITVSIP